MVTIISDSGSVDDFAQLGNIDRGSNLPVYGSIRHWVIGFECLKDSNIERRDSDVKRCGPVDAKSRGNVDKSKNLLNTKTYNIYILGNACFPFFAFLLRTIGYLCVPNRARARSLVSKTGTSDLVQIQHPRLTSNLAVTWRFYRDKNVTLEFCYSPEEHTYGFARSGNGENRFR